MGRVRALAEDGSPGWAAPLHVAGSTSAICRSAAPARVLRRYRVRIAPARVRVSVLREERDAALAQLGREPLHRLPALHLEHDGSGRRGADGPGARWSARRLHKDDVPPVDPALSVWPLLVQPGPHALPLQSAPKWCDAHPFRSLHRSCGHCGQTLAPAVSACV